VRVITNFGTPAQAGMDGGGTGAYRVLR
jgi:hypothetical protein